MTDPIEVIEQFEWVASVHTIPGRQDADYEVRVHHEARVDHEIHTLENLGFVPVAYRADHSGRLTIAVRQRDND